MNFFHIIPNETAEQSSVLIIGGWCIIGIFLVFSTVFASKDQNDRIKEASDDIALMLKNARTEAIKQAKTKYAHLDSYDLKCAIKNAENR